jgi:hypothetical protein
VHLLPSMAVRFTRMAEGDPGVSTHCDGPFTARRGHERRLGGIPATGKVAVEPHAAGPDGPRDPGPGPSRSRGPPGPCPRSPGRVRHRSAPLARGSARAMPAKPCSSPAPLRSARARVRPDRPATPEPEPARLRAGRARSPGHARGGRAHPARPPEPHPRSPGPAPLPRPAGPPPETTVGHSPAPPVRTAGPGCDRSTVTPTGGVAAGIPAAPPVRGPAVRRSGGSGGR